MRVRDQTSNDSQDCERVNLHVSRSLGHKLLIHGDEGIVLLIYVQILDNALSQKVLEVFQA